MRLRFPQVSKMQYLWPLVMRHLQDVDRDMSTNALLVFSNVVPVTDGRRVAHIAPLLAEKLLPLFDEVRLGGEPGALLVCL